MREMKAVEGMKEFIVKRSSYRIWELNELDANSIFDLYLSIKYA